MSCSAYNKGALPWSTCRRWKARLWSCTTTNFGPTKFRWIRMNCNEWSVAPYNSVTIRLDNACVLIGSSPGGTACDWCMAAWRLTAKAHQRLRAPTDLQVVTIFVAAISWTYRRSCEIPLHMLVRLQPAISATESSSVTVPVAVPTSGTPLSADTSLALMRNSLMLTVDVEIQSRTLASWIPRLD